MSGSFRCRCWVLCGLHDRFQCHNYNTVTYVLAGDSSISIQLCSDCALAALQNDFAVINDN